MSAPRPLTSFFGTALREALQRGYSRADLRVDILAGLVVGVIALPLSMALAVASGVPPQHGLYTAIIAGLIIGLLGGSRVQVSGPTAAFVVILAPIAQEHGIGGLLIATMMAGLMLVALGLMRFGQLMQFVPYPVTTGFTAGIGVVIATLQIKDLAGLSTGPMPDHYFDKLRVLHEALPTYRPADLGCGVFTLALLLILPRLTSKVPAPLAALSVVSPLAWLLSQRFPELDVVTIRDRFQSLVDGQMVPGIPQLPPMPVLPWALPDASGQPVGLSLALLRELAGPAIAIALLGAIESLLTAVVADGMTGHRHDPDGELVAQGVGNILSPFFGGIAATGAIARTAASIRAGARSPVASIVHGAFVLVAVLVLAPLLGFLPMSALAAMLLVVAWNMSHAEHFFASIRTAPRSDTTVQLTCFALTVAFDMVVAISVGVVLAALLFMRRMAEVSGARLVGDNAHPAAQIEVPQGVLIYEVAGPLFFGATHKAVSALETVGRHIKVIILDLEDVPAMDATALVNLSSTFDRLNAGRVAVILAQVQDQPERAIRKAGWTFSEGRLELVGSLPQAVERSKAILIERRRARTLPG